MSSRFLDALRSGRLMLMDGAMGTEIQRAGAAEGECLELWNLTHPQRIGAIHQAYVDAGAACLVTNTFQAGRATLQAKGIVDAERQRINERGVELARSVGAGTQFILGSIGPPPELMKEIGDRDRLDRAAEDCLRQAEVLQSADGILLETQSSPEFIASMLQKKASWTSETPFLISFSYAKESGGLVCPSSRAAPEDVARFAQAHRQHLAALGVNCGRDVGLADVVAILRAYRKHTTLPVFARPNAGTPVRGVRDWVYPLTPKAMADRLPDLLAAGATLIGGCCGTGPEHIRALSAACLP